MNKDEYDVIIVGAGVSGLYLAKLLNHSSLKVLLIDKRKSLTEPINNLYGTFGETVKKFGLEKYVTKKYSKFSFSSKNEKSTYHYESGVIQIVDWKKFAKDLNLTSTILLNTEVTEVERVLEGIKINNSYYGKLIIDCSGGNKIIAKKLGGLTQNVIDLFSTSYELVNCNIDESMLDECGFMVNLNYSNAGLWFYPYDKKTCQIGHTDFYGINYKLVKHQEKSLDNYIKAIEPYKSWLKDSKIVQIVRQCGPTTTVTKQYGDNYITCGDAGGAGTPLVGEGFRIALEMSLNAQDLILKAFENNDFSKELLSEHENYFSKGIGNYYIYSIILRYFLLNGFTNVEYDIFTKNIGKLSIGEFYKALQSNITFGIFLKVFSYKLGVGIIKNIIKSYFSGTKLNERIDL